MAMSNVTNIAANATVSVVSHTQNIIIPTIFERFEQLLVAPWHTPSMLWILGPLVIVMILMEFYFGRYSKEELGWNTAVGNSTVLFFVSIDLLRLIYQNQNPVLLYETVFNDIISGKIISAQYASTIIALAILTFAILLLTMDFFHALPKKLAFFISNVLFVNLIAYVGIVLVYSKYSGQSIPYDWYTLTATIMLFIFLWAIFALVKFLEPKAKESED